MEFQIVDTYAAYRRLLEAPDAAARAAIFEAELIAPFAGLVQFFGGDGPAAFARWGMAPEQFAGEQGAHMAAVVAELAAHDAWGRAARALARGRAAFAAQLDQIGLATVVFGLYLADLSGVPLQRGYSGFGGLPGWIMTVYGEPTPENLARVEAATVHELHHNVRFRLFPFNPAATTVGEYIVAEGLAEAFAAELCGEELIGPWVTEFDETRLDEARRVIGAALELSGFDLVRGYIFGDTIAEFMGLPPAGVPDFAGYALGYRVVRAFLRRSGADVAQATLLPARQILAESGFF